MVAAEHERPETRPPPAGDLCAGGVQLLARRGAVGELAVADVGQRQVFEVALERGRVRFDRVRREPEITRTGVRPLAEVDAALERDAVDRDAGLGEARVAGDEARGDGSQLRGGLLRRAA
jgi:hypothetical protein